MERDTNEGGGQLGFEGVEHIVRNVEQFCEYEQQRIALVNQPRIVAIRAELALFAEQERDLQEQLRLAPPPGDVRSRRRKVWYYGTVALILTLAGFFFSLIAFDPFRLGWKSYLYCVGIAIAAPFCTEKFLESWGRDSLIKVLAAVACAAAIAGLVLLAVVRGDVLAQQIKDTTPVVAFGDDNPVAAQPENTFYDETLIWLRIVMVCLAVAMDLGAGLALYDARRWGAEVGSDYSALSAKCDAVRLRMITHLYELTALENEAGAFAARFWRDFYRSMLTHAVRNAITKVLLFVLALFVFTPNRVHAAEHLNLVVMVDLTESVAVKGHDGKTEREKNFHAVSHLLSQIPAGAHLTILGITDTSFAQPYILLSADIGDDEGYFKERIASARKQLTVAWQRRIRRGKWNFSHTDVLGALMLASQIFEQRPQDERKALIIFSDMRQYTGDLNLETRTAIAPSAALAKAKSKGLIANLREVDTYVLGAGNAGKSPTYWNGLHHFWREYFKEAGCHIERYTILRDPLDLR